MGGNWRDTLQDRHDEGGLPEPPNLRSLPLSSSTARIVDNDGDPVVELPDETVRVFQVILAGDAPPGERVAVQLWPQLLEFLHPNGSLSLGLEAVGEDLGFRVVGGRLRISAPHGLVLEASDFSQWRLVVDTEGALTTEAVT